jgi:hypothetical protein
MQRPRQQSSFALLPLLLAAVMVMPPALSARRLSSTQKLKVDKTAATTVTTPPADTIAAASSDSMVQFAGYEKTLRSTRETVFLVNRLDCEVERVIFHIIYRDAQGRQLHQARKDLYVGVPAGETRRLDFPSWDKQCTFYYIKSPRPRTSAIPYDVELVADTLVVIPNP